MNGRKLFVGGIPWSVDETQLSEFFSQAGGVLSTTIIKDRDTNRSRGFGFVEMSTEEEAQNAVKNLNGADFNGRKIVVNIARPREERGEQT